MSTIPTRWVCSALLGAIVLGGMGCSRGDPTGPTAPSGAGHQVFSAQSAGGHRPILSQVKIKRLQGGRFQLTATAVDRDSDLVGGKLRLRLLEQHQIIQTIIAAAPPVPEVSGAESERDAAATPPTAFAGPAILNGTRLTAIFSLSKPPKGEVKAAVNVTDAAGNRSADARTGQPPPAAYGASLFGPVRPVVASLLFGVVAALVMPQLVRVGPPRRSKGR